MFEEIAVKYFLLFIILAIILLLYIKTNSKYFNIIDSPNKRSSHKIETKTGGGIVVPISIIFWYLGHLQNTYFFSGILLISLASVFDDIRGLKVYYRLIIQAIAILLLFQEFEIFLRLPITIPICLIIFLSWINAFNFMDGINGMAGLYTIISLLTFLYINNEIQFVNNGLLLVSLVSIICFGVFNFRKKAILFLGDVGSISMSFILAFVMFRLLEAERDISYLLFFSVYGVDSFFTIIERILNKENITKAHRKHLYQILVNEIGFKHLYVSIIYSFIQLLINIGLIFYLNNHKELANINLLIILVSFLAVYIIIKFSIKKKVKY